MKPLNSTLQTTGVGELYAQLGASAQVKAGEGLLAGIFVSSGTGGSITVYDSLTGSGTIAINTFNTTAGVWYPLPIHFLVGCYVVISGTIQITVVYS